jgi:hypothetical protein
VSYLHKIESPLLWRGIVFFVIFAVIMEALILDFEVFPQL